MKINAQNKLYYKNTSIVRDAYYDDIYNYIRKKNANILEGRCPNRITEIKSKTSRDNAKKQFRNKIKSYKIDEETNRLLYKKLIIVLINLFFSIIFEKIYYINL